MIRRVDETDVTVLAEALQGRQPSIACGARAKVRVTNEEEQHNGSTHREAMFWARTSVLRRGP